MNHIEAVKTIPSILNELKGSVILMMMIAWLTPLILMIAIGGYAVHSMADTMLAIKEAEQRQVEIWQQVADQNKEKIEWMIADERRDSTLHEQQVILIQELTQWLRNNPK